MKYQAQCLWPQTNLGPLVHSSEIIQHRPTVTVGVYMVEVLLRHDDTTTTAQCVLGSTWHREQKKRFPSFEDQLCIEVSFGSLFCIDYNASPWQRASLLASIAPDSSTAHSHSPSPNEKASLSNTQVSNIQSIKANQQPSEQDPNTPTNLAGLSSTKSISLAKIDRS